MSKNINPAWKKIVFKQNSLVVRRERKGFTLAVVFIPWVDAVLNPITHQGVVNTHVAVAEECIG